MNSQSGFLIGIGSNIEPHDNLVAIIDQLLEYFSKITLSRVLLLPPIGMNSQYDFLNVVVFIETAMAEEELKEICNAIETSQGRDRTDPTRKTKDRPADLDILSPAQFPKDGERASHTITDEYFLYPLLDEIAAYVSGKHISVEQEGVALMNVNLAFGQTATTIHRQTDTRNKRII
ncbi:MAG: 2-amino-4-hydroxy-6-hydroxymethyldihydropteridine diphosphokinase [Methylophaga sp.]|nr:2-amino-4-hydroxy-6-hydroxymethyldihydropteridine diphosphokinase [Methylophaga sp.]